MVSFELRRVLELFLKMVEGLILFKSDPEAFISSFRTKELFAFVG